MQSPRKCDIEIPGSISYGVDWSVSTQEYINLQPSVKTLVNSTIKI